MWPQLVGVFNLFKIKKSPRTYDARRNSVRDGAHCNVMLSKASLDKMLTCLTGETNNCYLLIMRFKNLMFMLVNYIIKNILIRVIS